MLAKTLILCFAKVRRENEYNSHISRNVLYQDKHLETYQRTDQKECDLRDITVCNSYNSNTKYLQKTKEGTTSG